MFNSKGVHVQLQSIVSQKFKVKLPGLRKVWLCVPEGNPSISTDSLAIYIGFTILN